MSELSELSRYNFEANESRRLPGTEDWLEVAKLGDQGGYSWSDFNAYYSPSARRYFWHGDSGCSCNGWGDELGSSEDLQNGGRADLHIERERRERESTPIYYQAEAATERLFSSPDKDDE